MLQLIIGRSGNSERRWEGFSDEITHRGDHSDAAVHDFGFAIAFDFVEGDAVLGEAEGVEVSGGREGSGEAVAGEGFVGCPSVDRGHLGGGGC